MVTLNAHFDGKVLVPDEPLALQPNQKVRISVEPIDAGAGDAKPQPHTGWHALIGIAHHVGQRAYDPSDEDALWEGTTGNHLENGPNKPSMNRAAK